MVLKPYNLDLTMQKELVATSSIIEKLENKNDLTLEEFIDSGHQKNLLPNHVLQLLANGVDYSKNLTITDCVNVNGKLYYQNHLYVPDYYALHLYLCCLHQYSPTKAI